MVDSTRISPDNQASINANFDLIDYYISESEFLEAKKILSELHYADLADYIDKSPLETQRKIILVLDQDFKAETLVWLDPSIKNNVAEIIGIQKMALLIEKLDIEDAIEVIEDLEEDFKDAVISHLNKERQQEICEGFAYPEGSAGRIMSKDFVTFPQSWTVGQAIESIKSNRLDIKEFYAAIIVNHKNQPVGKILLSALLTFDNDITISDFMDKDFKIADTFTDQEELSYIFKHYALTIVPVVNKKGKVVGKISLENIVYIIDEQAEEDIMRLGGVNEKDIYSRLFVTTKQRFPWLFVNLMTAFITSSIISLFEDTIMQLVSLAAIMPIVASMGGNAGTQAVTVAVRSIANKDITESNALKVIIKETIVAGTNGILLGIIGALFVLAVYGNFKLAYIFLSAVIICFFCAGFLGSAIPIFLNKLDIDPAVSSGVFLTALTDSIGFFTFLALAFFFVF